MNTILRHTILISTCYPLLTHSLVCCPSGSRFLLCIMPTGRGIAVGSRRVRTFQGIGRPTPESVDYGSVMGVLLWREVPLWHLNVWVWHSPGAPPVDILHPTPIACKRKFVCVWLNTAISKLEVVAYSFWIETRSNLIMLSPPPKKQKYVPARF